MSSRLIVSRAFAISLASGGASAAGIFECAHRHETLPTHIQENQLLTSPVLQKYSHLFACKFLSIIACPQICPNSESTKSQVV
jgi:hypothetical protein